jgi:hypothetical protein
MNTKLVGSIEVDGGGHVWVVYHSIPLVEPKLLLASSSRYLKGKSEQNLIEKGTRAVIWGNYEDGSIIFY